MPFRDTSRSVNDLLYSLGTSLQRFKGENGLKRVFDAGKLTWLSFVGEFEETRDELFSRRTHSLTHTRKCLLTLNALFEDVTKYATKMTDKVDQITKTLDSFHRCCDLELENPEDDANTNYIVAEEKLRDMRKLNNEIRKALGDFCDSASTCKTLNASTLAQLEEADKETAGTVGKAQTDFDAQRRRVQVKEEEVARLKTMGARPGGDRLQFAEFNVQCEKEALQTAGDTYFIVLQDAMQATSFTLEQTCMATWASSNVFFVQQAAFLRELEARVTTAAKLLVDIKNSQTVSKQIGVERKAMLESLHPKASLTPPADVTSDPTAQTDGMKANFDDLENLFGPSVPSTVAPALFAPAHSDPTPSNNTAVASAGEQAISQQSPTQSHRATSAGVPPATWNSGGSDLFSNNANTQSSQNCQQPSGAAQNAQPTPSQTLHNSVQQPSPWTCQQDPCMHGFGGYGDLPQQHHNQPLYQHALPQEPQQGVHGYQSQSAVPGYQPFQQQQQQRQYSNTQAIITTPSHANVQSQAANSSDYLRDLFQS